MRIDKTRAQEVLRRVAAGAEGRPESVWDRRFEALSSLAPEDFKTHIAFTGTALLARAVDLRADVFSIKVRAGTAGAYSARSLAKDVLAPLARELKFSIGPTGPEPLNNQPYLFPNQLSSTTAVHPGAIATRDMVLEILGHLEQVSTVDEAEDALAAYVRVRRRYYVPPPVYTAVAIRNLESLIGHVSTFVAEDSEGGKRAQAVVAGLFDVAVGEPDRVKCDRINAPDRHYPGDVAILDSIRGECISVLEVRDKVVTADGVMAFLDKVNPTQTQVAGLVAVSAAQPPLDAGLVVEAAKRGILLRLYIGWEAIFTEALFWSHDDPGSLAALIHERIFGRLVAVEASSRALSTWQECEP